MVKFSRQLDAQLIPEWKNASVNYRQLKKNVKKIKYSRPNPIHQINSSSVNAGEGFGFPILDPIRRFVSPSKTHQYNYHHHNHHHSSSQTMAEEEDQYEVELMPYSREDEVKQFFERLDEELEKINKFYEAKEVEFIERRYVLNKQLQILVDLKKILHDRRSLRHLNSSADNSSHLSRLNSPSDFSGSPTKTDEPPTLSEMSSPVDELVAALERNGVTFINSMRSKGKKLA